MQSFNLICFIFIIIQFTSIIALNNIYLNKSDPSNLFLKRHNFNIKNNIIDIKKSLINENLLFIISDSKEEPL
jgi:hypothetical protein